MNGDIVHAECRPGCGLCCDPVILGFPLSEMIAKGGPSAGFARQHWAERGTRTNADGEIMHEITCDAFDPHTRLCTAHEDRPPICSGFPWYGGIYERERELPGACSFNADVHTLIPITPVTRP